MSTSLSNAIQLAQMKIVERAVRPLHATHARKRKMREELLAHLHVIFEEELQRSNDPDAAMIKAARRFGDPAQLTREFATALTARDRREYWFEWWFGWRPPESAVRMMLRVSLLTGGVMAGLIVIPLLAEMYFISPGRRDFVAARTLISLAIFAPLTQFLIGVCFFKTRDALFGVFGSRKSVRNGMLICGLGSICMMVCGAAAIATIHASFAAIGKHALPLAGAAIVFDLVCLLLARTMGLTQIEDTIWASLDLKATG